MRAGAKDGNTADVSTPVAPVIVAEQLGREPYPYPQLRFARKPKSIFDYTFDDFELVNYQHHPAIKAPIAV